MSPAQPQDSPTPTERAADVLLPAERMALMVARAQVARGEDAMPNVAAVCIMALDRLAAAQPAEPTTDAAPCDHLEAGAWASGRKSFIEHTRASQRRDDPQQQSVMDSEFWRGYESCLDDLIRTVTALHPTAPQPTEPTVLMRVTGSTDPGNGSGEATEPFRFPPVMDDWNSPGDAVYDQPTEPPPAECDDPLCQTGRHEHHGDSIHWLSGPQATPTEPTREGCPCCGHAWSWHRRTGSDSACEHVQPDDMVCGCEDRAPCPQATEPTTARRTSGLMQGGMLPDEERYDHDHRPQAPDSSDVERIEDVLVAHGVGWMGGEDGWACTCETPQHMPHLRDAIRHMAERVAAALREDNR